ncbi:Extracellular metalloproteinase 5 [Rhizoctonia solani]|uniref:Extracellular metalloproteinase n=1 Tax=Rhizoctonia solani TaxID=456999 RepID=A0A0K6GET5_9AGAM|nr:Extracellular metalloproteinase 5 [Rhizoctonia solani]
MLLAHPEMDVVDDLTRNFDTHLHRMSVTFHHAAADPDGRPTSLGGVILNLPGAISPVEFRQVYFQTPTEQNQTELHIVWRMEVEMLDNWYEAYVSASDPKSVLSVVDWVSDSRLPQLEAKFESHGIELNGAASLAPQSGSYKVWKWGINDPGSGNRSVEQAWYDSIASPLGWHTISRAKNPDDSPDWIGRHESQYDNQTYLHFTSTWGNNVFAQENWGRRGNKDWIHKYRPDAGSDRNFVYDYCHESGLGDTPDCSPRDYVNVSVTQLFYTVNMVHDLYYRYGFDEVSGNFQQDNYERGGRDNDAVIAYAQDGSGSNNARFTTPPDGKHGRCHMYLWDYLSPARDSDFDAGTLIHELTHGLSNRLTGGPANSGCLNFGESGGLGEGWGDFLATTIRSTQYGGHGDFAMGDWVSGDIQGVRYYLYSTNRTVNPQTYATMNELRYWGEHEIGEIWAEALWIVMHGLIRKHGFSSTLFPPEPLDDGSMPTGDFYRSQAVGKPLVPRHGNTLMVQ